MTNLEKFLEVFGYKENADNIDYQCLCPCIVEGGCEKCRHYIEETKDCGIEEFWQSEYKEPDKELDKEQFNAYLNSINASIGAIRLDIATLYQSLDKAADVESEVQS